MTRKMFMFCGLLILFTDSFGRKYLIKTEGISFVSFVYFHWYHIKDETENMDEYGCWHRYWGDGVGDQQELGRF